MSKKDKRARATGRLGVEYGEKYALLPEEVLESAAYQALPDWAVRVLLALAVGAHQHNNGVLGLTYPMARKRGVNAQWKLYAGIKVLEATGLVVCTRRGHLSAGTKLPSLYALNWRGIAKPPEHVEYDPGVGQSPLPSNAWSKWEPPDNWREVVRDIKNRLRGTKPDKKTAHTTTGGVGRYPRGGAEIEETATPVVEKESPNSATPVVVSSKTSGRGSPKKGKKDASNSERARLRVVDGGR